MKQHKMQLIVMIFFLLNSYIVTSYANSKAYEEGANMGKGEMNIVNPGDGKFGGVIDKDVNVEDLKNLKDHNMSDEANKASHKSDANSFLEQAEKKKIDAINEHNLSKDSGLIKDGMAIEADPMKATKTKNYRNAGKKSIQTTKEKCLEGVEFEIDVNRELIYKAELKEDVDWKTEEIYFQRQHLIGSNEVPLGHEWLEKFIESSKANGNLKKSIAQMTGKNVDSIGNVYNCFCTNYLHGIYKCTYEYKITNEILEEKGEYWIVNNAQAEEIVESNSCYETKRQCLESGDKLFFGKYTVNRPCWKEKITYQCKTDPLDGCKYLKDKNCQLTTSDCQKRVAGICLKWQRHYECRVDTEQMTSSIEGSDMFCLGGDCHNPVIEANTGMENIAYLAALQGVAKDMGDAKNPNIFKGGYDCCRNYKLGGFIQCCSANKGWGKSVGLQKCKPEEKALAIKKEKGLCTQTGNYCAARDPITKSCIEMKQTYCCFGSKLARIFQEQGRAQLGISWGDQKSPDCRGFTIDELQKIDFTKLDLQELYTELFEDVQSKAAKSIPHQMNNTMPTMQKGFDPSKQRDSRVPDNEKTVF